MKHTIAATIFVLMATSAFAADQTWTGSISDKMCGADHKKMSGTMSDRECTLACEKKGSPFVLVADGKAYPLAEHDADLRTHAGHTVKITGELKDGTIHVSKIAMMKQ